MTQVTIGTRTFDIRKLPAYPEQMLLAKAVLPVYQDLIPVISKIMVTPELREAANKGSLPPEIILEVMDRGFTALQKMSDDQMLQLSQRSLIACAIQQGGAGWSPVMLPSGQLMFQNLELNEILQLIWKVVEVNLGGFFAASLGTSQGDKPKE